MNQRHESSVLAPQFSIVIPVYNDWDPLRQCLTSLAQQRNAPAFEVIVVDDGSTQDTPETVTGQALPYPLSIVRQRHSGIPSARNFGIRNSTGTFLLFVDADCILDANCFYALNETITRSPQHDWFQLRITGNRSSLVGRAEELRLATFQSVMLEPDLRIRYLNTAGFAVRRTRVDAETGVFDPTALRAEDTLLLANLMRHGELPLFVPDAIVEHTIPLSLMSCFRKDIRTGYLEGNAYGKIVSTGVRVRVTQGERLRILRFMWNGAGQRSIGRSAWLVVVIRQMLQRTASSGSRILRFGARRG